MTTTAYTKLRMSRGAPAIVAATYAVKSTLAASANSWNRRSPTGRGAPRRSHSGSYTLIQTPPGRDVRRLADRASVLAADLGRYCPKGACPGGPGRVAQGSDPVRHVEPARARARVHRVRRDPLRTGRDRAPVRRARNRSAEPRRSLAGARYRAPAAPLRARRCSPGR